MSFKEIIERVNMTDFQNNLWTILASSASSVFSAAMFLVTVRTAGLAAGGILSFAVSITALLYVLVHFGVRPVQAVDVKQEYSLNSYLGLRLCTAFLAVMVILKFVLVGSFEADRVTVILSFFFIYLIDGIADVFMGDLQQNGKMRIAGRMRTCAFILSLITFSFVTFITSSLITALIVTDVIVLVVYLAFIWFHRKHFKRVRMRFDTSAVRALALNVLPLLILWLVVSYLTNAQKYFLGFLYSDEAVAVVAILMTPVIGLNLLSSSFFQGAEMTKTAQIYANGTINDLSKRVNHQLLVAAVLGAIFLLCSFTFGIPLLSWLFNADLSPYRREYAFLTLSGLSLVVIYISNMCILLLQLIKKLLAVMMIIAIIFTPAIWFLVSRHGMIGATFSHFVIQTAYSFASFIIYRTAANNIRKGLER